MVEFKDGDYVRIFDNVMDMIDVTSNNSRCANYTYEYDYNDDESVLILAKIHVYNVENDTTYDIYIHYTTLNIFSVIKVINKDFAYNDTLDCYMSVVESRDNDEVVYDVVPDYFIVDAVGARGRKFVQCSKCGRKVFKMNAFKTSTKKYICVDCMGVKDYHTKNNNSRHKASKNGITIGFEFECKPYNDNGKATFLDGRFGFIPTNDTSIRDYDGIEFKSPIYQSMCGLKKMFRTLEKAADFSDEHFGQHIHVGSENYTYELFNFVSKYQNIIFGDFCNYLIDNMGDTERVFGRIPNLYCAIPDKNNYNVEHNRCFEGHGTCINVLNPYTIEFRLCKFVNTKQYFNLACFCVDVMKIICTWGKRVTDYEHEEEYNEYIAHKMCQRIIRTFTKYVDGKATCQIASRNTVK